MSHCIKPMHEVVPRVVAIAVRMVMASRWIILGMNGWTGRMNTATGDYFTLRNPYTARAPSSSSMRSSWLYFAIRSLRLSEPVLI